MVAPPLNEPKTWTVARVEPALMADFPSLLDVDVEIADRDNTAGGPDVLLELTAELLGTLMHVLEWIA